MTDTVPKILIVGGGYAGFYTAWKLEKLLRRGEAEVTLGLVAVVRRIRTARSRPSGHTQSRSS